MKFFYQILITPSILPSPSSTTNKKPSDQVSKPVESTITSSELCKRESNDVSNSSKETSPQTKTDTKQVRFVSASNSNATLANSSSDRKGLQSENNKSKLEASASKEQKVPKTSSWNFKSLRSNDIKCNDFIEAKNDNLKSNRSGTVTASDLLKQQKSKPNNIKDNTTKIIPETVTSSNSNNHCNNDDVFSSMKKQQQQQQQDDARKNEHFKININKKIKEGIGKQYAQKNDINSPNIVVSIPQSRRVSLSDDDFENLSLATLKTANKKMKSSNLKQSISVDESMLNRKNDDRKPDIPKLKIELSSLKAKISLNKSKSVGSENKRSFDFERDPVYPTQVDLTEYAKNIGLKPIARDDIEKKSDSSYESGSSHKKRKKSGKHSKEPGSKRRKFHAEISSQEEGKLKVKITGNKLSKHERKNSSTSSSDDNNAASRNGTPDIIEEKPQSEKEKLLELRKVRHKPALKLVNNQATIASNTTIIEIDDDCKIVPVHPITTNTVSPSPSSASFTFAKPKTTLSDIRPKTNTVKTYLSGVKFPTKTIPPPIRPIANPRVFSPPLVPNYPNFVMPQPKNVSNPAGSFHVNRPTNSPIKRSYSTDSPQLPKQLKLEPISRKMTIPDLIQATPIRTPKSLETTITKPSEPYYNSAMSSTYTHEITTKKPTPILLPPSSISVTKMSDTPKPVETSNLNNRPALEIVRISPTATVVDHQHNQQMNEQKNQLKTILPKANRPPPPTIPLVKIRNASNASLNNMAAVQRKMMTNVGLVASMKTKTTPVEKRDDFPGKPQCTSDNTGPLDLSGRTENVSVPERKVPPLSPSSSIAKQSQGKGLADTPKFIENVSSTQDNNVNVAVKNDVKVVEQPNSLNKGQQINNNKSDVKTDVPNNIPQNTSSSINSTEKKDNKVQPKVSETTKPTPTLNTAQLITTLRQLSSMPKLNEINKMRSPPVRQQNASVRNIPNPSALAFRNQVMTHKTVEKQPTSSASTPTASSSNPTLTMNSTSTVHTSTTNTSSSISYTQSTTQVTSSTCAPIQVKPNTLPTSTSNATSTLSNAAVSSMKPTTPSTAVSSTKISTPNTQQITKQPNPSSATSSNNDVNNAKLITAKKKNLQIEKVVATLRAAASENSSTNSKISTVA